ncbi:hydroxysqualene dehydroxylase [Aquabacterium humicola]|uniref:hydroxysqualene dehydroxylase n=1 Tax=Aquabacterium humicola TaxID=3237377 RepID=UPI002543424F|nr:FAD-dependent oxidoreductase [Rubrivivax pictus]
MGDRVVILGGGVAGMSAAHELVERGFVVQVFEKRRIAGGKARSVPVPGSGTEGRRDLPGEHGFRFFPRFYRHLPDTMRRIPYGDNRHGVEDNLVETTRLEYPLVGQAPIVAVDRFPRSLADWKLVFKDMTGDYGFQPGEQEFFAERIWQIITSCEDRRVDEYERLGWWEFVGAATRSPAYQKFLAGGLTRSLNAAKAQLASTRTIGDVLVQLLFDILTPGTSSDRLLNGPTNDVWIDPWLAYLREQGVDYQFGAHFERLNVADGRIASATVTQDGRTFDVQADHYLCCVPLEVMARHITPELLAADSTLQGIVDIRRNVQWMNGIQFYLKQDVPIVHGHALYVDSAWALTSVSQAQFWPRFDFARAGDGTVRGILSVDISEWEVAGSEAHTGGRTAKQCTHEEIAAETWYQLKQSLNRPGAELLTDDMLHSWFLDPDIIPRLDPADPAGRSRERDSEPLLVNYINSWDKRPDAYTRIPNLFLAADYVRTYTDLATMEGANEAARRAVNSIIDASGSSAPLCQLWKLHEPELFAPWRANDQTRYDAGMPWDGELDLGKRLARLFG